MALRITLKKSLIGYEKSQGLTARALGLNKVGSSIVQPDTSPIRGMIKKITHVLTVETEQGEIFEPNKRTPRKRHHGPHHGDGVNG